MPKGHLVSIGMPWRFLSRSTASTRTRPKKRRPPSPPRGVANNGDFAHLYSGNILYDPGVELFVGNAVESWSIHDWNDRTGEAHFTLPNYKPTCDYWQEWPNGDCVTYWDIAQWTSVGSWVPGGGLDSQAWHVTRVDPYLGDFSMAWWKWSEGPGGNPLSLMVQSPGLPGGYSARVNSGDRVGFSARIRMEPDFLGYTLDSQPKVSVMLYYYDQSGAGVVGSGNYYQSLTKTYAEYSHDTFAPSGSYFVRAMVAFKANNPSAFNASHDPSVLVDSGVLSIE